MDTKKGLEIDVEIEFSPTGIGIVRHQSETYTSGDMDSIANYLKNIGEEISIYFIGGNVDKTPLSNALIEKGVVYRFI